MTPEVRRFWCAYLARADHSTEAEARYYDTFSVGDSAADADEGTRLILSGAKTATSSLLWAYEAAGTAPPAAGSLSIVLDGRAAPVCVVETVATDVRRFDRVAAALARDYGEWDGTLPTWRAYCWTYYATQCESLGRSPRQDMPLVCERFRVIFAGD